MSAKDLLSDSLACEGIVSWALRVSGADPSRSLSESSGKCGWALWMTHDV